MCFRTDNKYAVLFSGFFVHSADWLAEILSYTKIWAELDKKLFELGQKSGELDLDFYLKSP